MDGFDIAVHLMEYFYKNLSLGLDHLHRILFLGGSVFVCYIIMFS